MIMRFTIIATGLLASVSAQNGDLASNVPSSDVPSSVPSNFISDFPSSFASDFPSSAAPVFASADCVDNMECAILNLTGICCPTLDNWTLACCGGPNIPVYEQCANQTKCARAELDGACCPTPDGKYLDCCGVVPDFCVKPGACPIYSTEQYKSELAAADRNATAPSNAYTISITAASTLLVVAMAAFVVL
jgi:hypothetical protein